MGKGLSKVFIFGTCGRDFAQKHLALVRRRFYKRLIIGDIREGSYILLKEYTLERANKIDGEGEVMSGASKLSLIIPADKVLDISRSRTSTQLVKMTERSQKIQTI